MTNPITEPTQSIRERLARALYEHKSLALSPSWDERHEFLKDEERAAVDVILAELMEPSEGMLDFYPHDMRADCAAVWRRGVQHIRSGGK